MYHDMSRRDLGTMPKPYTSRPDSSNNLREARKYAGVTAQCVTGRGCVQAGPTQHSQARPMHSAPAGGQAVSQIVCRAIMLENFYQLAQELPGCRDSSCRGSETKMATLNDFVYKTVNNGVYKCATTCWCVAPAWP
jgi:hypothetical protein